MERPSKSETSEFSESFQLLEVQAATADKDSERLHLHSQDADGSHTSSVSKLVSEKEKRFDWRSVAILFLLICCCIFLVRSSQQANAHLIVFVENIKPRFFEKDPLAKFDDLFDAAWRSYEAKRYTEALLILDAAVPETESFGSTNVYLANILSLKGECYFAQGDLTNARLFYTKSIKMWYSTRGRRTSAVARVWELLAETYSKTDPDICRKCLNKALWSYQRSAGPFYNWADRIRWYLPPSSLLNCWHPTLHSYYSGGDFSWESGRFLVERLNKYDDILNLQENLLNITNGDYLGSEAYVRVKHEGDWTSQDFFNQILEFRKLYPCPSGKEYNVSVMEFSYDSFEYGIFLRARILNRQGHIFHLLGKLDEAADCDNKADECFRRLLEHRAATRYLPSMPKRLHEDQCADDWVPIE